MGWVSDLAMLVGIVTIFFIILEAFETLVLPRRIERPLRGVALFYGQGWALWRRIGYLVPGTNRDNFLSLFGPLSLLLLMTVWALGFISAFALIHWALQTPIQCPEEIPNLATYLYLSATTFITLGLGDVSPKAELGRVITDMEAGIGFGFLAIIVGYFPVLYGAFSRREVDIALLDARASSPPSAGALLQRLGGSPDQTDLLDMLRSYERWAAELMESHLSYPVLMWYRSQHDRQSWLSALTTMLDTCALLIAAGSDTKITWQARMTFAMSRHAAVDLAHVFNIPPAAPNPDRLTPEHYAELRILLTMSGITLREGPEVDTRLSELRYLYEPFVNTLAKALELSLPSWLPNPSLPDNWQTSAWDHSDHFFQTARTVLNETEPPQL